MNKRRASPILDQGFFTALASELVLEILARLPVRTIISCKCVCKSWLSLISSDEFSKFHLSKSVPSLCIAMRRTTTRAHTLFEIEDGLDLELNFNPVAKVSFRKSGSGSLCDSATGLIFFGSMKSESVHICNPITREYVQLPFPRPASSDTLDIAYGFGASKITGQLKAVRIFRLGKQKSKYSCEVHTLGTGSWRRTAFAAALNFRGSNRYGSVLNGNLHWLVEGSNGSSWISCFDLEAELFSIISTPNHSCQTGLSTLRNNLCLCDNIGKGIVIWLMKEYGVEKSWTKEFVINHCYQIRDGYTFYPIRILNDGVLLRAGLGSVPAWYSKKNGTFRWLRPEMNGICCRIMSIHTPSFVSLKSFGMENVRSL